VVVDGGSTSSGHAFYLNMWWWHVVRGESVAECPNQSLNQSLKPGVLLSRGRIFISVET